MSNKPLQRAQWKRGSTSKIASTSSAVCIDCTEYVCISIESSYQACLPIFSVTFLATRCLAASDLVSPRAQRCKRMKSRTKTE